MTTGEGNVIHAVGRRILKPAYVGMLSGLLVRSVALVISVGIPYETWPLLLKIGIELMAALGMVACADIVTGVSSARGAQLRRQIAAERNNPDYRANPRLSKDKFEQEQLLRTARMNASIEGLEAEGRRELFSLIFGVFVTMAYGFLFAFMILRQASLVTVLTEIIGVATIPFVTWYLSAQYQEQQAAPDERAKATANEAVDMRLVAARERFAHGTETDEDISLLAEATKTAPTQHRLVQVLRKPKTGVKYLTTPDIYKRFGITDASAQAVIRRKVRTAGVKMLYGVMQDPETDTWLTPEDSLVKVLGDGLSWVNSTNARRQRASTARTNRVSEGALDQEVLGQRSDNVQTMSDDSGASDIAVVAV